VKGIRELVFPLTACGDDNVGPFGPGKLFIVRKLS